MSRELTAQYTGKLYYIEGDRGTRRISWISYAAQGPADPSRLVIADFTSRELAPRTNDLLGDIKDAIGKEKPSQILGSRLRSARPPKPPKTLESRRRPARSPKVGINNDRTYKHS